MEIGLKQVNNREVRRGCCVGHGCTLDDEPLVRAMRFDELTYEPRLSDTGLADESDDLPVTRRGAVDQALKLSKLGLATHERRLGL